MPKLCRWGKDHHAHGGKDEAVDGQPPATAPAGARTIGRSPGPWNEEEQKEIVDRHDTADGSAMVAEGVTDERRDEALRSGPVTPANSPPRPTTRQARYGVPAAGVVVAWGRSSALVLSIVARDRCAC